MKEVDDCIAKMIPPHNRDDFKQDLFLKLLGWNDKWKYSIVDLYENNRLIYYVVRAIIQLATEQRGTYQSTYIKPQMGHVEITDWIEIPDRGEDGAPDITDEMIADIDQFFNTNHQFPFYRKMVEAMQRVRSMRELSRETGIPVSTISKTMKKVRSHIKSKLYD